MDSDDLGRGELLPGIKVLEHAFKTPTLRNVSRRAPYMHNGSEASLREVVDFYDSGFAQRDSLSPNMKKLGLTEDEKEALVAFLYTLTSEQEKPVVLPVLPESESFASKE